MNSTATRRATDVVANQTNEMLSLDGSPNRNNGYSLAAALHDDPMGLHELNERNAMQHIMQRDPEEPLFPNSSNRRSGVNRIIQEMRDERLRRASPS